MDPLEATNVLMSKIRSIDPENATKIMGYILIQDLSERDLLRLVLGPEPLLQNVVLNAKTQLGILPNSLSTPNSPSPLNSNNHHIVPRLNNSHNPFSQSSPRLLGNGPFSDFGRKPPPLGATSPSWPPISDSVSPKSSPFLYYDNIRSGSGFVPPFSRNGGGNGSGGGGGGGDGSNSGVDLLEGSNLDEYLSFLDDSSLKSEDFVDQRVQLGGFKLDNGDAHLHRRRFSESDVCFGDEDGGLGVGFRPCLYNSRGFCKNGDDCKFVHGAGGFEEVNGGGVLVGSPGEMESLYLQQQQEEMMRMKVAQQQQQRLAYNKYMNFLLQQQNDHQRFAAAAMGDELHTLGLFGSERNDFLAMVMAEKASSASRQIYLTFPADSTFKDEDVSNYFSNYGPVQDVRIPYQQKRMFGFVTFVHSETVKQILSRGNPHYICDSRVLVKPYKEKGKVANERQQHLHQQFMERGNFTPSSSPSGLDPREFYEFHLGARMAHNSREMMLRMKLEEQAELQHTIELQRRRMVDLKLPDLRGDFVPHHHRSLSVGSPISLANHAFDQNVVLTSDRNNHEPSEDNIGNSVFTKSTPAASEEKHEAGMVVSCDQSSCANDEKVNHHEVCNPDGLESFERDRKNVQNAHPDCFGAFHKEQSVSEHSNCSASAEAKKCTDFTCSTNLESHAASATSSADVASN